MKFTDFNFCVCPHCNEADDGTFEFDEMYEHTDDGRFMRSWDVGCSICGRHFSITHYFNFECGEIDKEGFDFI